MCFYDLFLDMCFYLFHSTNVSNLRCWGRNLWCLQWYISHSFILCGVHISSKKVMNASYFSCLLIRKLQLSLQILGIIENMSCFKCPHCGEPSYIFGKGGTHRTAAEMGLEFLGEVCWLSVCILYFLYYNFADCWTLFKEEIEQSC